MAIDLHNWNRLRIEEDAFYRYLAQPTAMAEQLYDANFNLIDIRSLLKVAVYALWFNAVLLALILSHTAGWWS
jgi:hypothetical protein